MKTIIVTGTPGTGKTTLSKRLAKKLSFYYIDANKIIFEYNLSDGYDRKRKTKIIDVKKLNKKLIYEIKNIKKNNKTRGVIIDSHLSHYLPKKYTDFCIVTKCDIKELSQRLKMKKFNKNKIQENVQAEIFDICLNEAKRKKHKVIAINTTKGFNIKDIIRKLGE